MHVLGTLTPARGDGCQWPDVPGLSALLEFSLSTIYVQSFTEQALASSLEKLTSGATEEKDMFKTTEAVQGLRQNMYHRRTKGKHLHGPSPKIPAPKLSLVSLSLCLLSKRRTNEEPTNTTNIKYEYGSVARKGLLLFLHHLNINRKL